MTHNGFPQLSSVETLSSCVLSACWLKVKASPLVRNWGDNNIGDLVQKWLIILLDYLSLLIRRRRLGRSGRSGSTSIVDSAKSPRKKRRSTSGSFCWVAIPSNPSVTWSVRQELERKPRSCWKSSVFTSLPRRLSYRNATDSTKEIRRGKRQPLSTSLCWGIWRRTVSLAKTSPRPSAVVSFWDSKVNQPGEDCWGRRVPTSTEPSNLQLLWPSAQHSTDSAATRESAKEGGDVLLKATRKFEPNQSVWARNYGSTRKWLKGVVTEVVGPLTYRVTVGEKMWKRHVDQLRSRIGNPAEVIDDNAEDNQKFDGFQNDPPAQRQPPPVQPSTKSADTTTEEPKDSRTRQSVSTSLSSWSTAAAKWMTEVNIPVRFKAKEGGVLCTEHICVGRFSTSPLTQIWSVWVGNVSPHSHRITCG